MTELWIAAIASTIAGCIWAAWGPKALLGTIAALAVLALWDLHTLTAEERHRTLTSCFDIPGQPYDWQWKHYENPADCRKTGGVPYRDRYPE